MTIARYDAGLQLRYDARTRVTHQVSFFLLHLFFFYYNFYLNFINVTLFDTPSTCCLSVLMKRFSSYMMIINIISLCGNLFARQMSSERGPSSCATRSFQNPAAQQSKKKKKKSKCTANALKKLFGFNSIAFFYILSLERFFVPRSTFPSAWHG